MHSLLHSSLTIHITLTTLPSLPSLLYQVTLEGVARIGSFYMPFTTPGIRCVPLFTSSDSVTDIGPMVILGMPFLREYVTRFDRTSESMAFARLRDNSICNACADGHGGGVKAAEEKGGELMKATSAAATLQPEQLEEGGAHPKEGVLRMEDLRMPWWSVHPALRPSHVKGSAHVGGKHNATAVAEFEAGRSPWKLVL